MPRTRARGFSWILCFSASLVAGGCCDPVRELDKVAKSVDRYGFASISTPFLAGPTDEFEFGLKKSADEYFNLAFKPQGGFRHFSSEASDTQVAFRANLDQAVASLIEMQKFTSIAELRVAKSRAGAQKKLLETMMAANPALAASPLGAAGSTVADALGVIAETPEPELPEYKAQSEGLPPAGPPFAADARTALSAVGATLAPSLPFPEGPFQISSNEAIHLSNRDVWTQSLFNWFAKPHGNKLSHYELIFCPMIVSVQPGYETRDGFLADITVNVDLARRKCDCPDKSTCDCGMEYLSKRWSESNPPIQVAGVFPVIDSQVLDLVNSRRQLHAYAFQLSIMGFGQASDFFRDYAKKLESDAQTATTLTAASAYTAGATAFGFRVEPKLVASRDPGQLETAPGRILESRTFPAMAALLIDRRHLGRNTAPGDDPICPKHNGDADAYEYLVFETVTRWAPVRSSSHRYSEIDAWKRAQAFDDAEYAMQNSDRALGPTAQHQLKLRTNMLRKLALDSRAVVRVYDKGPANCISVKSIAPNNGWLDQFTLVTVTGKGFRGNVHSVSVGGTPCDFSIPNDQTLLIAVAPWAETKKTAPSKLGELARTFSDLPLTMGVGIVDFDNMIAAVMNRSIASTPPDPLPSVEDARLKVLMKKIQEGSTAELEEAAKLAAKWDAYRAWEQAQAACAEVVISSDEFVHVEDITPPTGCAAFGAKASTQANTETQASIGWIAFHKELPAPSAKKQPKATITFDKDNKVIQSVTTEGDFASAAHLLEVVNATIRETQGVNLRLNAEGGLHFEAATKPNP